MTLSGRKEITLSEHPSALRDAVPKPSFRFQLGEPVDHRGIVLAPLFPLRDPVARYATLDDALARGLEITEINPILDDKNATARVARDLVLSALGKAVL